MTGGADRFPPPQEELSLQAAFDAYQRFYDDAPTGWTTWDALSELDSYLNNMEEFSSEAETADHSRQRLEWIGDMLARAALRDSIPEPTLLGISHGLDTLLTNLAVHGDTQAEDAVVARRLLRLELRLFEP